MFANFVLFRITEYLHLLGGDFIRRGILEDSRVILSGVNNAYLKLYVTTIEQKVLHDR